MVDPFLILMLILIAWLATLLTVFVYYYLHDRTQRALI
jgi:NADH:ubiquinone oxidoreductase subunit 5 (subunit L)/multisubunit Na+/H+ antiporter MnhA subunit